MLRPLLLLCLLALPEWSLSAGHILLLYNERLPYMETRADGEVAGLTAGPAQAAFLRAGIPYQWKKTNADVQWQTIKENQVQACLVGWFKNVEREKLGKYTHALFEDGPTVALALIRNTKMDSVKSLRDLLQSRDLTLLVKQGYSYGKLVDSLMVQYGTRTVVALGENTNMMGMIAHDRADYFFAAEDEAVSLLRTAEDGADFRIVRFSDSPAGEARYLWCTRNVPDAVIDQLNDAIDQLKPRHSR